MQKTMKVVALVAMTLTLVLGPAAAAFGQAAAPQCPPGQPFGRPPGVPPSNEHRPDGRPPQYPPGRCQLALSQSAGQRGDTFTATGGGFVPGETVTFSIAGQRAASAVADGNGVATASIVVPDQAAAGRTEVLATAESQTLSAAFEIVGAPAANRSRSAEGVTLPRTGAEIAGIAAFGLLLVVLGATAVVVARDKKRLLA